MKEAFGLWLTPSRVHAIASLLRSTDCASQAEQYAAEYVEIACRPLLALKASDVPRLSSEVIRCAIAGNEPRLRATLAMFEAFNGHANAWQGLLDKIEDSVPDLQRQTRPQLAPEYAACFDFGARVYFKAIKRVTTSPQRLKSALTADRAHLWYHWLHVASCLDLCATTVLIYLDEEGRSGSREIVENLCVNTKELGLTYGAILQMLLESSLTPNKARPAKASKADLRWDLDFTNLNLPDFRANLFGG